MNPPNDNAEVVKPDMTPDKKSEPKTTLEHSLDDAEVLVTYVIRYNVQDVQDAIEGVAEAREAFKQGKLMGDAQKHFYANFSALAAHVAPVNVSSLRSSLEEYGIERKRWFFWGKPVRRSYAQRAATRYSFWGMVALLCLLAVQSYWLIGSNLLNAVPKFTDAQKATLWAADAKKMFEKRTINQPPAAVQAETAPAKEAPPTEKELVDKQAELAAELAARDLVEERTHITDMLAHWCRMLIPKKWLPLPEEAKTLEERDKLDPDRVIALASRILEVLQQYVLPLLYGWLGAMAYVLRTLGQQARARTYSVENRTDFSVRAWLGIVAGLAIGWFFRSDKGQGSAVGSISALALAFVAGYSVDLLFTAMDRIVGAFSGTPAKESTAATDVKAEPAVKMRT